MKKSNLFLRKSMNDRFDELEEESHKGLKRHLKAGHLTAIGIGAIIGAGIFVITGQAAASYAGPAIFISFLISGLICVVTALCYAELASLISFPGGMYSYAYVALGELAAWIVGWGMSAQYLFLGSTVAVGWSGYFVSFLKDLGIAIPAHLTASPLMYSHETGWALSGATLNVPAMGIVLLIGILVSIGIRAATYFNFLMVIIKLATIALFVGVGLFNLHPENWFPFIPENTGVFGEFGWSGVFRGAGMVFFAYIGFDAVSTLAKDSVNPQKNIPLGIMGSLFISSAAYIAVCLVLTGVVSYKFLGVTDPMAVAIDAMGPKFFWIGFLIKLAILAGLASVVLVDILTQTRIFFAMGRDGLLSKHFSKVHEKTRTPLFSTVATFLIATLISGVFPINILGDFCSMTTLFIFCVACLAVLVLRYTHPKENRTFKVPFSPYVPAFGVLVCVGQMAFFPSVIWLQLIGWMAAGFLIYFGFSVKNSRVRKQLRQEVLKKRI
jgi:APA family basic amino acid/polyamine antiporter